MALVLDQADTSQVVKLFHIRKGEPVLQSFKQVEEFAQTGGHLGPPDFEKEINQHRVLLLLNFSCDDGP